jgi:hypothetical protein
VLAGCVVQRELAVFLMCLSFFSRRLSVFVLWCGGWPSRLKCSALSLLCGVPGLRFALGGQHYCCGVVNMLCVC